MTEMKAQLLTELPYHRIESPRKPNKYLEFFGSYIALPLMSIILVVSLLVLFLLVKTYFSNSYMYAIQDNLDNKNSNNLNIGPLIDNRFDQFNSNNRKQLILQPSKTPQHNNDDDFPQSKGTSILEKALASNARNQLGD